MAIVLLELRYTGGNSDRIVRHRLCDGLLIRCQPGSRDGPALSIGELLFGLKVFHNSIIIGDRSHAGELNLQL